MLQEIWFTLIGVSLLFVGGFVLWVYIAQTPVPATITGPEAEATRRVHGSLAQWFFLYGIVALFIGFVCLAAAIFMMM